MAGDDGEFKSTDADIERAERMGVSGTAEDIESKESGTDVRRGKIDYLGKGLKGCLPAAFIAAVGIIAVIIVAAQEDDRRTDFSAKCPAPNRTIGGVEIELISYEQACPPDEAADGSDDASDEGTSDDTSEDSASDEGTSDDGTAGGGNASSDSFAKPSEEDLPEGAVLYSGTSGGPIGCIPCDGQSRFMSVEADGAVVGNDAAPSVATTWAEDGQITSFGARLSVPNPGGRYGIGFFYLDTFEYGPGVNIEVDETSAEYQWTPEQDGTVHAGRPVVIIVGEGGHTVANGDYELEWWFVFEPD